MFATTFGTARDVGAVNSVDVHLMVCGHPINQYISINLDILTLEEQDEILTYGIKKVMVDEAGLELYTSIMQHVEANSELFDNDPQPKTFEDNGLETDLNKVIEIQERMSKGMKFIKEAQTTVNNLWKQHKYAGLIWKCWSGQDTVEGRAEKVLAHPNNQIFIKWLDYRKNLWVRWNALKDQSKQIADMQPRLWAQYFRLVNEPITPYYSNGNTEQVDNRTNECKERKFSIYMLAGPERDEFFVEYVIREKSDLWKLLDDVDVEERAREEAAINAPIKRWEEPQVKRNNGTLTRHWEKGDRNAPTIGTKPGSIIWPHSIPEMPTDMGGGQKWIEEISEADEYYYIHMGQQ